MSGGLKWQYIAIIATFSSFILFYCKWAKRFTYLKKYVNDAWIIVYVIRKSLRRGSQRDYRKATYLTDSSPIFAVCWIFTETALSGCNGDSLNGAYIWTAGQRIDPSRKSTFVWRVTSTDTSDTVSTMTYTKWRQGQPDYYKNVEACMHILDGNLFQWNDYDCSTVSCSVCELDI